MIVALVGAALVGAAYPIAIYPVLVALLARVRPRPWAAGSVATELAHIVTVYNEERRLRAKIEDCLRLKVPAGCRLETIVVSDGSDDGSEAIALEYRDRGVRWMGLPRRGKEAAQIDAVHSTNAPILVFSDAAALVREDALHALVAPFRDPSVLAVSGTDVLNRDAGATGEGLYVRLEMALRRAESLAGSLVGLSGCLFAVRRELTVRWRPEATSDLGSALLAIAEGGRAVAADRAICTYDATPSVRAELRRKRRTILRGLHCLWAYRDSIRRDRPIEAWQIVSHKWWRFTVPLWLVTAGAIAIAEAALTDRSRIALAEVALAFAALALAATAFPRLRRNVVARAVGFGFVGMLATILAWKDFLTGRVDERWAPTRRP